VGPIASLRDVLEGIPPTAELGRIGYALRIYEFEIAISLADWTKAEEMVKASSVPGPKSCHSFKSYMKF
jgi:hypothetical protein